LSVATHRKQRANGAESRRRIIEAALEIAAERGYEGTSIALVSERSGLPASSIYWHFASKDELIAAVIQHSFDRWHAIMRRDLDADHDTPAGALADSMRRNGAAVVAAPDFLRLGLMLALERRPEEPSARALFLDVRRSARAETEAFYRRIFGGRLAARDIAALSLLAMAATDGLFIAREIDGVAVDLDEAFELVGVALAAVADHLDARRSARRRARRPAANRGA
jgi:AcrR family transcriptional regulator